MILDLITHDRIQSLHNIKRMNPYYLYNFQQLYDLRHISQLVYMPLLRLNVIFKIVIAEMSWTIHYKIYLYIVLS